MPFAERMIERWKANNGTDCVAYVEVGEGTGVTAADGVEKSKFWRFATQIRVRKTAHGPVFLIKRGAGHLPYRHLSFAQMKRIAARHPLLRFELLLARLMRPMVRS